MSNTLWPHELQHARFPIQPFHPRHPLLLLPLTFPSIRVFSRELSVHINRQSIGASTSVLPMSIQGWFPLGLTGFISLLSKGLSRVFSSTRIQKYQSLALSLLYGPTLTSIHDYWTNHSFDQIDLCQQIMSLLFNVLSRFVIAILPRSKWLLISWLQVTVHVDSRAQENKMWHCFYFFPICLLWSDRTRCHDLHFFNVEF